MTTDDGMTIRDVCRELGISRRTFYRIPFFRQRMFYVGSAGTSARVNRGDVLLYKSQRQGIRRTTRKSA